ncbi:MAG: MFS transporter [Cyanobacteria bacterium]|nr:MFS transporter [Cyanobacteriota bacterium]
MRPTQKLMLRLSLGHMMADFFAGFMIPVLPLIAQVLHLSLFQTGLMLLVSSLTSSVFQPLYGWCCDRFPTLNAVLLGLVLGALCLPWIGSIGTGSIGSGSGFLNLLLLIFVGYAGVGFFHPQAMSTTNRLGKANPNLMMGLFFTGGTVGFSLGPLCSSILAAHFGLASLRWVALTAVFAVLLFGTLTRTEKLWMRPRLSERQQHSLPWQPDEIRFLVILSVMGLIRALVLVGLPTFMPFLWRQQGVHLETIGWVIALSSLAGGPLGVWAGHWADSFKNGQGEFNLLLLSFIPPIVLLPWMLNTTGNSAFVLFIAVIGLLSMSLSMNLVLALKRVKKQQNVVSGLVSGSSFGLAGLLMPVLGGLSDHLGIVTTLSGLSVLLVLATLLVWHLRSEVRPLQNPEAPAEVSGGLTQTRA